MGKWIINSNLNPWMVLGTGYWVLVVWVLWFVISVCALKKLFCT